MKLQKLTLSQLAQRAENERPKAFNVTIPFTSEYNGGRYTRSCTTWTEPTAADLRQLNTRAHNILWQNLKIARHSNHRADALTVYAIFKQALIYQITHSTTRSCEYMLVKAICDLYNYAYIEGQRAERARRRREQNNDR